MERIHFMNIFIDNVSLKEALWYIDSCVREKKRTYVVTPNVDHMVQLSTNKEFLEAYLHAGLVAVDGTPIMLTAKWYHTPLKEKIIGPRLAEETVRMAKEKGYRIFFLGGAPGVAQGAAERMEDKYKGLIVAGTYAPPYGFEKSAKEKEKIVSVINLSEADIVLAGMGSPKTEIFLYEYAGKMHAGVSLSVGAAIDFLAGNVKRCPRWVNRIGLEWLYRFFQEPGRLFHRYFVQDPKYLALALHYKRVQKQGQAAGSMKGAGSKK